MWCAGVYILPFGHCEGLLLLLSQLVAWAQLANLLPWNGKLHMLPAATIYCSKAHHPLAIVQQCTTVSLPPPPYFEVHQICPLLKIFLKRNAAWHSILEWEGMGLHHTLQNPSWFILEQHYIITLYQYTLIVCFQSSQRTQVSENKIFKVLRLSLYNSIHYKDEYKGNLALALFFSRGLVHMQCDWIHSGNIFWMCTYMYIH